MLPKLGKFMGSKSAKVTGKSQNALLFSTKLHLKGSAFVHKGSIAHFYLLLSPLPLSGIKNDVRYSIFCLKPCRHRNHNQITFLFQNYHPNIFRIATSTSILNHKHLHRNRNSIASQDMLQKVCYWTKNKTPAPIRKWESFGETLQQNFLYRDSVQLPSDPASSTDAGASPSVKAFPGQTHQDLAGCSSLSVKQGELAQIGQLNTKNCLLFLSYWTSQINGTSGNCVWWFITVFLPFTHQLVSTCNKNATWRTWPTLLLQ